MPATTGPSHTRRIDRLGVHSLDHFSFAVPNLDEAKSFYEAFGLDVQESGLGLELRCVGDPHLWAIVTAGPRKRIGHLSFGAYVDDLDRFAERLDAAKIKRAKPLAGFETNGLWFHDPHGMLIEIRAAAKVMPDAKELPVMKSCPAGLRGAPMRGETPHVHPRRMAHMLIFTPDVSESIRFSEDILGLRLSDYPGPVAFMHGVHGSDHHLIAFAESRGGIGYHHSAWDVATLDEVGLGAAHMAQAGFNRGWGLGRHVLGSNYFHYVRDPWGSYAEYSFDIDYVPAEKNWQASYPAPENSLFLWGPSVPDDFVTNHEAVN